jgi:hypothetical protein
LCFNYRELEEITAGNNSLAQNRRLLKYRHDVLSARKAYIKSLNNLVIPLREIQKRYAQLQARDCPQGHYDYPNHMHQTQWADWRQALDGTFSVKRELRAEVAMRRAHQLRH